MLLYRNNNHYSFNMENNRYTNAIDNLVSAFIKGKLTHGNECSCAVGNMCNGNREWYNRVIPMYILNEEPEEIKEKREGFTAAGYNAYEIVAIENAFEGRHFSEILYDEYKTPYRYTYFTSAEDDSHASDADGFKGLQHAAEVLYQLDADKQETVNLYELINL